MKSYYGNYLGVVITGGDKDPEHRGRTQVFIPNIMPALYENWNEDGNDITFEVIGQGLDGSLNPSVVERLRNTLPWAECAVPITGASPSYGTSVGGFVSEVIRNVGTAVDNVVQAGKEALGISGQVTAGDDAVAQALTGSVASATQSGAGNCGRGVKNILIDAYGFPSNISGANGQDWGGNFEKLGFKKVKINSPADAPAGSFMVYDSDDRRGQQRTLSRRTGKPTGGSQYGHVEFKGADNKYYFGTTPANNPGGSVPHNFTGYAYIPPDDAQMRALRKAGMPEVSPSALPHVSPTVSMQPDPTQEEGAAAVLDAQQKVDLGMQSSPEQMSLDNSLLATGSNGKIDPNKMKSYLEQRIASSSLNGYVPADAASYGVDGSPKSWANYFTKLSEKESGFQSNQTYKESFSNSKGQSVISSGLFQVSVESVRGYGVGKGLSDSELQQKLFDPAFNIDAAIAIHEKQVLKHGKIEMGDGKGAGGYFASASMSKIKADVVAGKVDSFDASAAASSPIATNQPVTQNPTPHHGISGPNTNNQALGMFGYASEGQAVWVFFREGNPLFPVYFAASYGNKEWGNMYQNASNAFGSGTPGTLKMQSMFYGGGFNSSLSTNESEVGQGHSFQLFDNNGSNLTFAKDHTQFNAMYNHVQRVIGDSHDITETNKEVRVKGNYNTFTEQDMFITVGNWTDDAIAASDEIQSYINEAMEIKAKAGKS